MATSKTQSYSACIHQGLQSLRYSITPCCDDTNDCSLSREVKPEHHVPSQGLQPSHSIIIMHMSKYMYPGCTSEDTDTCDKEVNVVQFQDTHVT
jgi:hypothetical protein